MDDPTIAPAIIPGIPDDLVLDLAHDHEVFSRLLAIPVFVRKHLSKHKTKDWQRYCGIEYDDVWTTLPDMLTRGVSFECRHWLGKIVFKTAALEVIDSFGDSVTTDKVTIELDGLSVLGLLSRNGDVRLCETSEFKVGEGCIKVVIELNIIAGLISVKSKVFEYCDGKNTKIVSSNFLTGFLGFQTMTGLLGTGFSYIPGVSGGDNPCAKLLEVEVPALKFAEYMFRIFRFNAISNSRPNDIVFVRICNYGGASCYKVSQNILDIKCTFFPLCCNHQTQRTMVKDLCIPPSVSFKMFDGCKTPPVSMRLSIFDNQLINVRKVLQTFPRKLAPSKNDFLYPPAVMPTITSAVIPGLD